MPWAVSFACGYLSTKNDHGQTKMPGVSHKSKHMPGKERYQSGMRLHGQRFPERSEKENPEPAPEWVPPDELKEGVLAARAGAAKERWWRDVEVVRVGFRKKGRPRALKSGERGGACRSSMATTGRLAEILALGSLGALLLRSFDL
jgi:hypothetical protein